MPPFRISVINHTLSATNDQEFPSFEEARTQAIKAAIAIGSDEVMNGEPFFGAEVRVETGEEKLCRMIVAIGISSLQ